MTAIETTLSKRGAAFEMKIISDGIAGRFLAEMLREVQGKGKRNGDKII